MTKIHIGKRPPQYSFILNPYSDVRLSKCPKCERPTHPRKFPLFIHIEKGAPLVLGKTCRFCTRCQLIIVHQDELEAELAHSLTSFAPEAVGNEYLVIGTVDKKVWQQGLRGSGPTLDDALEHVADFKRVFDLHVEGGWGPA